MPGAQVHLHLHLYLFLYLYLYLYLHLPLGRNYVCPTCEATGDRAHTARYCPYREGEGRGRRRSEGREEVAAAVMALLPTPMMGHIINMRNNLRRERGEL